MVSSKTSNMTATPLTATDFRHALGQFRYRRHCHHRSAGSRRQAYGMTANSFTSVSLDPFLTLVCVDQRSHLLSLLKQNRFFGVNVLKEQQQALSVYFAQSEQTSGSGSQARYPLSLDATGHTAPRRHHCTNRLQGRRHLHRRRPHYFLGEVQSADLFPGEPLLFFRSHYRQLAPPR